MKLHSAPGRHTAPKAINRSQPKFSSCLFSWAKIKMISCSTVFTLLASLVLLLPAAGAELPPEPPAPMVRSSAPEPEQMTDTERLAVGIYTVIHNRQVSESTARMVGDVIMNRVRTFGFPNTLDGVLRQRAQFGNLAEGYSWAAIDRLQDPDADLAYLAAEAALASPPMLPLSTLYVSDQPQGELVAYLDGLYFGR